MKKYVVREKFSFGDGGSYRFASKRTLSKLTLDELSADGHARYGDTEARQAVPSNYPKRLLPEALGAGKGAARYGGTFSGGEGFPATASPDTDLGIYACVQSLCG